MMLQSRYFLDMEKLRVKQRTEVRSFGLEFGQRLRSERLAKQHSLADLAQVLKVTKGYLSRLEAGKAKPSKRMIEQIARTLKLDPNPLYILADYLPTDVKHILYCYPMEAPTLLRETFGVAETETPEYQSMAAIPDSKQRGRISDFEGLYEIVHADCFDWMEERAPNSIHAVVTDPPYGLKEYTHEEKAKLRRGHGGIWRIPPTFDGCTRSPLPRFTVLTDKDKVSLKEFFYRWATCVFRVLVPGGHVFIASNPLLSHVVYMALTEAGFEKRGEIIRLVQTLRGGDRPKNAHKEFEDVTVMPRSCWEPWGLFRKPCEGRVQDNLRKWKTGGLRRISKELPFCDVIKSAPTRNIERQIAPHPSLKPQAFMRQVVRAALPLGGGVILDPFMGGGSTIAAACAVGYRGIGIESDLEFYEMAIQAIPRLASLAPNGENNGIAAPAHRENGGWQQTLFGE